MPRKNHLKKWQEHYLRKRLFVGGGILQVYDDNMTEEQINKIGEDYAMNSNKYELSNKMNEDLQGYAIRKLTPLECFRLMGVKDEDFDKVAQHQSNSSLYHLAGDSLLTTVMGAIFCNMIETPIPFQEMVNSLYKSSTKGGLK